MEEGIIDRFEWPDYGPSRLFLAKYCSIASGYCNAEKWLVTLVLSRESGSWIDNGKPYVKYCSNLLSG